MEGLYGWKFAVLMKQDERPTKSSMIGDGKHSDMTRWRWCMNGRFGTWET